MSGGVPRRTKAKNQFSSRRRKYASRLQRPLVEFYNYRFLIASSTPRRLAACILLLVSQPNVALLHLTHWQLPSGLLIDVARWQSPCSNPFVEDFLLQRKGHPFMRRIGIGPQTAKLQENFLFVLCHSFALE